MNGRWHKEAMTIWLKDTLSSSSLHSQLLECCQRMWRFILIDLILLLLGPCREVRHLLTFKPIHLQHFQKQLYMMHVHCPNSIKSDTFH